MHPEISRLPCHVFYQGKLRFFNVSRGLEEPGGRSIKNIAECQAAVALYSRLRQEFSSVVLNVGVVSMYKAQVVELRRQFGLRFGRDIVEVVDFNTVDGFQGQEKDVIILSCVRAGPGLQTVGLFDE